MSRTWIANETNFAGERNVVMEAIKNNNTESGQPCVKNPAKIEKTNQKKKKKRNWKLNKKNKDREREIAKQIKIQRLKDCTNA